MKPVYITILTIVDYSVTRDAKFDIDLEGSVCMVVIMRKLLQGFTSNYQTGGSLSRT